MSDINMEWVDIKQEGKNQCENCGNEDKGILYVRMDLIDENYSWEDGNAHYLCDECNDRENKKMNKRLIHTFEDIEALKKFLMVKRL
jgi:hypothetical protein